jgi:hypothetical protein
MGRSLLLASEQAILDAYIRSEIDAEEALSRLKALHQPGKPPS